MLPLKEFRGIYPDIHRQKINEFFKPTREELAEGEKQLEQVLASLKRFYVIGFTNRSGSNFLARSLASEGRLNVAAENLNFDVVINQSTKLGIKSYPGFLANIIKRGAGKTGIYGCKASAGQLIGLYNDGVLHQVRDRLTVIHNARQNLLEQAVSLLIASKTQKWTSKHEGVPADVEFDGDSLMVILEDVCRQNAAFRAVFELFGIEAVPVLYERMLEDPVKVVRRVGRHLGLPGLKYVPDKVGIEKQSSDLNAELLQRWMSMYSVGIPKAAEAASTADE